VTLLQVTRTGSTYLCLPTGLGGRQSDMHNWCYDHVLPGGWEEHGHSDDRRDDRGIRIDFCRFYFMDEADAEAFRRD
jgi:hypothetical protein